MENKQQASTFNEELEKDYEFEIEENKVDNGYCGSVGVVAIIETCGTKGR